MRALFLSLLIVLAACGKSSEKSSCTTMACEASLFTLATTDTGPVPTEALSFETRLVLMNFEASDEEKVEAAAALVKAVIRGQKFKDAVVGFTYQGERKFADNNGLTNLQIYDRLIIAAERLTPARNFTLDAELELYYEDSNTIGYTYPHTNRIWMNTKFFDRYNAAQVAGNLAHEWVHKMGFTHASAPTPERPYSVPYAVGYIIRELATELY